MRERDFCDWPMPNVKHSEDGNAIARWAGYNLKFVVDYYYIYTFHGTIVSQPSPCSLPVHLRHIIVNGTTMLLLIREQFIKRNGMRSMCADV